MSSVALQILGIALLQMTILPSIALASVDLAVAWLVIFAVRKNLSTTIVAAACLALIVETYSVAPLGSYFGAYWLIVIAIHVLRHLVIWKLSTPWLVAFASAEGVVLLVETLTIDLNYVHLGTYLLQALPRVIATCVAGIIMLKISKQRITAVP